MTLRLAPVTRGEQASLFNGRHQQTEFAKNGLILALDSYFARNPPGDMTQLRQFLVPALILAIPVGLIVLQKDMGVALLTLLVGLTYLPLVRVPLRAWLAGAAAAMAALAAVWTFGLANYQQTRILDFIEPGRDPLASGYQALQSRIAVGSGGVLGKGWLEGTQSQLKFLPTQHTDFAFSVLAEEWGFLGCFFILGLYLVMLLWGLWIARNSRDAFGTMLAVGLVGTLFWPAAINIAMVLGLAPVIGVPLPLFSYGGSAIVAASISLSLLPNISMRRWALI
jgi:rod shape determining protein RodA